MRKIIRRKRRERKLKMYGNKRKVKNKK